MRYWDLKSENSKWGLDLGIVNVYNIGYPDHGVATIQFCYLFHTIITSYYSLLLSLLEISFWLVLRIHYRDVVVSLAVSMAHRMGIY